MNRRTFLMSSAIASSFTWDTGFASDKRPVRVLTSSTPGSVPDLSTRELVRRMAVDLDQPMFVENKPGGFGTLWANEIKRAPPDGITLGTTFMAMHSVFPVARTPAPFDPINDFTSLGSWTEGNFLLVATARSGYKSLGDVLAAGSKASKSIAFAVTSPSSPGNLLMELFKSRQNLDLLPVFYKAGELTAAGVRGDVELIADGTQQLIPFVESGQFAPLALFANRRSRRLPNVPTVFEAGVPMTPGLGQEIWHGMVGPAGMMPALVDRLHSSMTRVCAQTDFVKWNEDGGRVVNLISPSQMTSRIRLEMSVWSEAIRKANIKLEA